MASSRYQGRFPVGMSTDFNRSAEIQLAEGGALSADPQNGIDSIISEISDERESGYQEALSVGRNRDSLLDAVKAGDSERVRQVLEGGQVNVNEKENGALEFAAIHYAAAKGDNEVMRLLVNYQGIDLNAQDGLGRTSLIISCMEGHEKIVRLLLEEGVDVLICARGDFSCLHMAAFRGHEKVVALLLHGVDPAEDTSRYRASREYWDYRYVPFLSLRVRFELLNKTSSLEKFTALHMVARANQRDERGLDTATSIVEAYMAASLEIHEFGPFNSDELYLMKNENWYKDFLLNVRDIINVHEGERSSEGSRRYSPINHPEYQSVKSLKRNFEGVVQYEALVEALADLISYVDARDCIGRTALHYAAWHNMSSVVEFLVWDFQQRLSLGSIANVNASDLDGYTPLHLAAWKGNKLVVKALLLDARERYGENVKDAPERYGERYGDDVLLKIGLNDLELKFVGDEFTITGLEYGDNFHECNNVEPNAVASSNAKSRQVAAEVELVFPEGQDIDERSLLPRTKLLTVLWEEERGGLTPLHCAVDRNHAEVVELLLSHPKIDVFGESSDGKTPWALAFPKGKVSETWNTAIPWMMRTGGRLLDRVRSGEDQVQKLQLPPADKYKQYLVEKAVSLACAEERDSLGREHMSNKLTLYVVLEIQICLSLLETFVKGSDHHDQSRVPLRFMDPGAMSPIGFGDLHSKGLSNVSSERIKRKLEKWEIDRSKKPWKLTLLHLTAYYGFHKELQRLLALRTFRESLNTRESITGRTALDLAVALCNTTAVNILLQEKTLAAAESDKDGRTPLEVAVEMQSKVGEWSHEKWKGIEGLLRGREDVQRYVDNLYRDRQVFVDAANAILVGAALIASVTFGGWLQPPLNFTQYYNEPMPYPAPPGTFEQYAAVEQHQSVQLFWAFNSLSFFSAIATVVAGAGTVLPAQHQFIKTEVQQVRGWLVFTSILFSVSIVCVTGAFTAAGFAALPPIARYMNNMVATSAIGLFLCIIVLVAFLHKLYFTVKSGLSSYLKTLYATVIKHNGKVSSVY